MISLEIEGVYLCLSRHRDSSVASKGLLAGWIIQMFVFFLNSETILLLLHHHIKVEVRRVRCVYFQDSTRDACRRHLNYWLVRSEFLSNRLIGLIKECYNTLVWQWLIDQMILPTTDPQVIIIYLKVPGIENILALSSIDKNILLIRCSLVSNWFLSTVCCQVCSCYQKAFV